MYPALTNQKKAGIAILIIKTIDLKTMNIIRNNSHHNSMIKDSKLFNSPERYIYRFEIHTCSLK